MTRHEVFFILGDFEGDLWRLSRAHHVWLVRSQHNTALAEAVWARESQGYSALCGVTVFDGTGDRTQEFYEFLGTIDEHHGTYSAPVAWSAIHVRGVDTSDVDEGDTSSVLGGVAVQILPESGGFAIVRQPN